jgi:hypothetical protein
VVGIVLVLVRGLRGVANPWSRDLPSVGQFSAWRSGGGGFHARGADSASAQRQSQRLRACFRACRSGHSQRHSAKQPRGAAVVRHTNGGFLTSQRAPSLGAGCGPRNTGAHLYEAAPDASSAQPRGRPTGAQTTASTATSVHWGAEAARPLVG